MPVLRLVTTKLLYWQSTIIIRFENIHFIFVAEVYTLHLFSPKNKLALKSIQSIILTL